LNNVTENTAWPLPNIPALLNRIGQQKPKLFAKLDLTSGYHQFPLHQNSWKFFAFIIFMGIYEWLRCVMGGKGVGAHFQKTMALEVLVGLIYIILELYLDDIIVFADSEEQFFDRLEKVYIRLESKRITLNPKKCEFGLSSIEFVGHTIDATGITFSKEKIQEVVTFRTPKNQKDLKKYLLQ
jgi:cleavage and polyadenylation specificity factor subunit 1